MSEQVKHTPGPWKIGEVDDVSGWVDIVSEEIDNVINIIASTRLQRFYTNCANARLITTAPDGLALAEMILADATIETPSEWIYAACNLIAKANGGES